MKTWVEINSNNLLHNIEQFRRRVGDKVLIAGTIKSNAYGHGMIEVAKVIQNKVDFLAVDSIDEALALPAVVGESEKQILILGYTLLDRLAEVVENGFHQVVANQESLLKLIKVDGRKKAKIHLKIETGTSRQGILIEDLPRYLELIKSNDCLELAGVSTHFANIEDTTDHSFAEKQLGRYQEALKVIDGFGFRGYIRHVACSAAAVLFPETHFDMIRLGISMYGLWSSTETQVSASQKGIDVQLKPCLTWKTKVAQVKNLAVGSCIGYGCTEKLSSARKVAILPIGYWDGYDRRLSSVSNVLIKGKRCRVLGRVCMNMIIVDAEDVPNITLEDEAVLLGKQADEIISAEDLAKKAGTINYEMVTRINPLIKRIIK